MEGRKRTVEALEGMEKLMLVSLLAAVVAGVGCAEPARDSSSSRASQVFDTFEHSLNDIAIHPRFAENRLIYFTYYKPRPGSTDVGAATLASARFDGGRALTDVRDLFVADAWTSAPSASRIAFGRDGKIYMTNEEGLTTVIKAGPTFEILAENPLDDYTLSSPAISDGQIFMRTKGWLYCIGKRATSKPR